MTHKIKRNTSQHLLWLWGAIVLYFFLNALTQVSLSGTADLDQSEQLILSQTFQLGYGAQPPLYTYITKTLFSITQPSLATLLVFKALLLSLLAGTFIGIGKQLNLSIRQQVIAVIGLVFIPQIIWESQRDLTHSVLVSILAAATLLQTLRLQSKLSIFNYAAMGLLIGLGVISKYNYVFFIAALAGAVFYVPAFRSLIFDKRVFVGIAIAIAISSPHIFWALNHYGIAMGSIHKIEASSGNIFTGLTQAGTSGLAYISPLWLFSLLLFFATPKIHISTTAQSLYGRFLLALLVSVGIVVAFFVIVTGAQEVKDRWYQPLLFFTPIVAAYFTQPQKKWPVNTYIGLGLGLALLVAIALPLRTLIAGKTDKSNRPNMPYPAVMAELKSQRPQANFILAETRMLGGNAIPVFKQTAVRIPEFDISTRPFQGEGIVLCITPNCEDKHFQNWLLDNYAIKSQSLSFKTIVQPYHYMDSMFLTIYWARVQLN